MAFFRSRGFKLLLALAGLLVLAGIGGTLAFYVAFLPHFVAPDRPLLPQFVLLGATFVFLGVINALLYAVFAGGLRRRLRSTSAMKAVNRVGGSFLIGAGLLTASIRRTA